MRDLMPKLFQSTLCLLLLCSGSSHLSAQEETEPADPLKLDYALLYPDEKAPELVKAEEDNPFIALADLNAKEDTGSSEENVVKDRLLNMKVVGCVKRPQGYRVQLGDLTLEEGMVVPPFLPDQSVHLRVNSISESDIEFVWLEKQRTGLPPRTLLMPIRMRPVVRQMLPGQRGVESSAPVFGVHEGSILKAAAAQSAAPPKRAEEVNDTPTAANPPPAEPPRKRSAADAVLDLFFNQGGNLPKPE
jgi:hypothetical protein